MPSGIKAISTPLSTTSMTTRSNMAGCDAPPIGHTPAFAASFGWGSIPGNGQHRLIFGRGIWSEDCASEDGLRGARPEPFDNAQDRPVEGPVPSGAEGLIRPTELMAGRAAT